MPSGRFVLRIDPELHGGLQRQAKSAGMSLNELCARVLAAGSGEVAGINRKLRPALDRAAALLGDDLVAAAVYGSAARGELTPGSDVDLLLVVEPTRRLGRRIYRDWDRQPIDCDGHPVEPHFAPLPEDGEFSGLWGELALEAWILFDPELRLHRRLVAIRQELAAGRLERRLVHGQPYWTRCHEVA